MKTWLVVLALVLAGCKGDTVKSAGLGLSWKPPRGVSLESETPGVLAFSGGVEIRSVADPVPLGEEGQLDALLLTALKAARVEPLEKRISARLGDIPAGKVARWVMAGGGKRALYYYVPSGQRFLLISMTTAEAEFSKRESQLDLSLSSLKIE